VNDSKPQGHPFSATTPDNVERVRDAMMWSCASQLTASSCTLLKQMQRLLNSSQGFALPSLQIQVAQNLVNGTWWANYSFAMNSWTWWKTIVS
jgi:hypothetical protein